jgi:hypothetical protein
MEYKQAELSRVYVIPESTISRALKRGDLVKNSGGRIDDENPRNSAYLSPRRLKANREAIEKNEITVQPIARDIEVKSMDLESRLAIYHQMQRMTIREAIIAYGSAESMRDFVGLLRDMSVADEKDQKVRERRLQLVEKDFIVARVFQYLDGLMRQLLEYPESSVDDIIALIMSKGMDARLDVSRKMETGISKIIKDAKEQVVKELSGLRAKYQDDDKIEEIREAIEEAIVK